MMMTVNIRRMPLRLHQQQVAGTRATSICLILAFFYWILLPAPCASFNRKRKIFVYNTIIRVHSFLAYAIECNVFLFVFNAIISHYDYCYYRTWSTCFCCCCSARWNGITVYQLLHIKWTTSQNFFKKHLNSAFKNQKLTNVGREYLFKWLAKSRPVCEQTQPLKMRNKFQPEYDDNVSHELTKKLKNH